LLRSEPGDVVRVEVDVLRPQVRRSRDHRDRSESTAVTTVRLSTSRRRRRGRRAPRDGKSSTRVTRSVVSEGNNWGLLKKSVRA
jgi:hypothetical protein